MEGSHLIGYLQVEKEVNLSSVEVVKRLGRGICKKAGLNVVSEHHHKFKGPDGITYCFILAESHLVLHTWPEEGKLFFDVFSCHRRIKRNEMLSILSRDFKGIVKKVVGMKYS